MRTTVRLNDSLMEGDRKERCRANKTLAKVIEEALREKLARREEKAERKVLELMKHPRV